VELERGQLSVPGVIGLLRLGVGSVVPTLFLRCRIWRKYSGAKLFFLLYSPRSVTLLVLFAGFKPVLVHLRRSQRPPLTSLRPSCVSFHSCELRLHLCRSRRPRCPYPPLLQAKVQTGSPIHYLCSGGTSPMHLPLVDQRRLELASINTERVVGLSLILCGCMSPCKTLDLKVDPIFLAF